MGNTIRRRRRVAVALALLAALAVAGCMPARPAAGRPTPVRKVLVVGDSMTWGLFGTTPQLIAPLRSRMAQRGIAVSFEGFPAEDPLHPWPGKAPWVERIRWRVATENPDVIVIQSALFPEARSATERDRYRAAIRKIYDVARSRDAHVYRVTHHRAPFEPQGGNLWVAEALQAEAARGRGIEAIPLDWWISRCPAPVIRDGWHLTGSGQNCLADSIAVAIDQLRRVVG